MTVQTENALKTVGYISEVEPQMEVAQIGYFGGEKIRIV